MAGKVRTRAMPGKRYGIDDANGMRLFTARLVEVGDRDDPRVRLDKIKLKAGKDVLLGGQVVLAHDKSTLEVMKVVLDAQFNSLRSAFGLEGDAAYGVDPSIEVYFLPGHDEARKIGSSVDDGKSYCCSVVRGRALRLACARRCLIGAVLPALLWTFSLATGWEEKKKKKNRPVVVFRQVALSQLYLSFISVISGPR